MGHLGDGALRRMIDEPLAASEADRRHLAGCAGCNERSERFASEAKAASALLAVPGFEPDAPAALARVRNRAAIAPAPRRAWASISWSLPRLARPLALAMALVVLGGTAVYAAPSLLTIFGGNPNQTVAAVPVTAPAEGSVAGLPDLSQYGTSKVVEQGTTQTVLTAAEATSLSHGLVPPAAPADYAGKTVTYTVIGQSKVSFTFDEAKAKAAAAAAGKPAPVFPAGIDGTTLTVTIGPAVAAVYGTLDKNTDLGNLPLITGVANAPVVTSTGVSAKELENFLVQQPGIAGNPALVAQIKAIGDPLAAGNLVIPIPANLATSTPTTVNGTPAVLIADKTGTVKGLVWEKLNIVYAVGGHFDDSQLGTIANGIG
ncbi:MAG TPA: hypothetical protein VIP52_11870 [Candidatus Dormibacteraeota bacterium]